MSIQTQIDRLKQAKADLISQITAKGVTVPAAASLDDLAELVAAISNGESLDEEIATQDTLIADILAALEGKTSGGSGGAVCTITLCDRYGVGFDVAYNGEVINAPSDGTAVTIEVTDGAMLVASQTSSMGAFSVDGCLSAVGYMTANNELVVYIVDSTNGTTGSIELVE